MSKSSSDKRSESERTRPERANHDTSKTKEQSDYYYDDATGYEIYEDDDDEENSASEN